MSDRAGADLTSEAGLAAYYQLLAARFDQAAKLFDTRYGPPAGSRLGNALVTWLREEHVRLLRPLLPPGTPLLDIGCGTGEEALLFAQAGFSVLGIDISPAMVWQAQAKAGAHDLRRAAVFKVLPAGRLETLDERGPFAGAYASLGTLNTEPDLAGLARGLHERLAPGAPFSASVMNDRCLFERWRGRSCALDRSATWHEGRAGTGGVEAPVRFFSPRAFARSFAPYFRVERVIAFPLWFPPVQMHARFQERLPHYVQREPLERRTRGWPLLRNWGDHFLMILRHAPPS